MTEPKRWRGYGAYIRDFRKAKKFSPQELADRLGTSKGTVDNLELERTLPSFEQIRSLQVHLGLSAAMLIELAGVPLDIHPQARLPAEMIATLQALSPERQEAVIQIARGWLRYQEDEA